MLVAPRGGVLDGALLMTTTPPGDTRRDPSSRTASTWPAHLATTAPNLLPDTRSASARPCTTSARVRPRDLTTSRKNEALLRRASTIATAESGLTILIGTPGTPAPDPMSNTSPVASGKRDRNSKLTRSSVATNPDRYEEPTRR